MLTFRSFCAAHGLRGVSLALTLVASTQVVVAASENTSGTELKWVGCGISQKAYMKDMAKAFEAKTGIKIDVKGGGATRGIREVANRTADIGGSCRNKLFGHPEEADAKLTPVGWDALVVIVNKGNPVDDITLDQLREIYTGKIKNWKDIGGPDVPVRLLVREGAVSGVGYTMRKLLFADPDQEFAASETYPSTGPLEKAVEEEAWTIGTTGISSARKRNVKILKLQGKEPTYENVKEGKYLLYRPLYLVSNPDNPKGAVVKQFIEFTHGAEGQEVMRRNGTVPFLEGIHLIRKKMEESRQAYRNQGLQ